MDKKNYDITSIANLEEDFTGGSIHSLSHHRGSTGNEKIDKLICELVESWGGNQLKHELIEELLITAYKINNDNLNVADLKLINRTLKEMREANKMFKNYRNERKVTVFGSARTDPNNSSYKSATKFSKIMKKHNFMTITGAGEGIMGAAQYGAGRDYSFGLNIKLPFEQGANKIIAGDSKLINFNYFFTRKLSFVKESHAIANFTGGYGTMDECFETLTLVQTGKTLVVPIVMVDEIGGNYWKNWLKFIKDNLLKKKLISERDLDLFMITDDVEEAVEEIINFYKYFHSYRMINDKLVIRVNKNLSDKKVKKINEKFSYMLKSGEFKLQHALNEEKNEPTIEKLPRLVGQVNFGDYGSLRNLINEINKD